MNRVTHFRTAPRPRRSLTLLAVLAAVATLLAACGSDKKSDTSNKSAAKTTIRISSQDFGEQKTLAQVYGQYLSAKGYKVDIQPAIGTRTQIYAALKANKVDLVLDYEGSAVVELKGKSTSDADANHAALVKALAPLGLSAGARSDAADANALVALTTWADQNGVKTISDLSKVTAKLTLAGAPECATRDDCLLGYKSTYGLDLNFKPVSYGPPLVAALEANEVQLAQYGTTAPEVADGKIVVLTDDKGLQSAENVVPVYRTKIGTDDAGLAKDLDALSKTITTADLAKWNKATDVDKTDPADVAEAWLASKGLN